MGLAAATCPTRVELIPQPAAGVNPRITISKANQMDRLGLLETVRRAPRWKPRIVELFLVRGFYPFERRPLSCTKASQRKDRISSPFEK